MPETKKKQPGKVTRKKPDQRPALYTKGWPRTMQPALYFNRKRRRARS